MTMEEIIATHEDLDRKLQIALATMERKSDIEKLRVQIIENQKQCPHFDNNYNWMPVDDRCPYCGKKL